MYIYNCHTTRHMLGFSMFVVKNSDTVHLCAMVTWHTAISLREPSAMISLVNMALPTANCNKLPE